MSLLTEADIRARLAEVTRAQGEMELALAYLGQEKSELDAAIRAFEKFHERRDFKAAAVQAQTVIRDESVSAAEIDTAEQEVGKPAGTPTVPDMIQEVMVALTNDNRFGEEGFEPKVVTAEIRKRWWADAPSTSISPRMWRMVKEGRLRKEGSLYFLPSSPEGETSGPSAAGPQQDPRNGFTPEGGGVRALPEAGGTC